MTVVGPLDAMFLGAETRAQPMHVGGLMVFELPEGVGRDRAFPEDARDFVLRLYQDMVEAQQSPRSSPDGSGTGHETSATGPGSRSRRSTSSTTSGCQHCPAPAGTASCSS